MVCVVFASVAASNPTRVSIVTVRGDAALTDAIQAFETLREYFFRYYDTPFALADEAVQKERLALLDQDGASWREPWIEPLRDYQAAGRDVHGSCAAVGAPEDLADFARCGLVPAGVIEQLYKHQEDALAAVLEGRHLVITAGRAQGRPRRSSFQSSPRCSPSLRGGATRPPPVSRGGGRSRLSGPRSVNTTVTNGSRFGRCSSIQ